MAKHIKLDDAIEVLKSHMLDEDDENVTVECPNECNEMLDSAVEYISAMPTVEIVRCKDCIHRPWDTGRGWPDDIESHDRVCPFLCDDDDYLDALPPNDDFYCAYGERKDNGSN